MALVSPSHASRRLGGHWMALVIVAAAIAGCDRRIEEPTPEVRPLDASDIVARDPPKPWGKRCVRQSTKMAERKAPRSPALGCPEDPSGPPKLRTGKVTFANGKGETVSVELAEQEKHRERGLMYRRSMADNAGMLFLFEEKTDHTFWMHNTCIPLDMLFLDDDGLIVGIEENTATLSDNTFSVGCASKYVLEVNAGFTRAHGVMAGQRVVIDRP